MRKVLLTIAVVIGMLFAGLSDAQAAGYSLHNNSASQRDVQVRNSSGALLYVWPGGDAFNGIRFSVEPGWCIDYGVLNGPYVGTVCAGSTQVVRDLSRSIWTKVYRR